MTTIRSTRDSQLLAGTNWRLDPRNAGSEFCVPNFWGLATVKGGLERLEGRLGVDDDHAWRMQPSLDAGSLDTGNARKDEHLPSAGFFAPSRTPRCASARAA